MSYNSRLKVLRKILGYSQRQMGEMLGIGQTTYSNYETVARGLPNDIMTKLTEFGVSAEWLLTGQIDDALLQKFRSRLEASAHTPGEIAASLKVPESFLLAVSDGQIMPSRKFISTFASIVFWNPYGEDANHDQLSIAPAGAPAPIGELSALREKVHRLEGKVDLLATTYNRSIEEIAELKMRLRAIETKKENAK